MEIRSDRHAVTLALCVAQGQDDEIDVKELVEFLESNHISVLFRDADDSEEYEVCGADLCGMGNKSAREDLILAVGRTERPVG